MILYCIIFFCISNRLLFSRLLKLYLNFLPIRICWTIWDKYTPLLWLKISKCWKYIENVLCNLFPFLPTSWYHCFREIFKTWLGVLKNLMTYQFLYHFFIIMNYSTCNYWNYGYLIRVHHTRYCLFNFYIHISVYARLFYKCSWYQYCLQKLLVHP